MMKSISRTWFFWSVIGLSITLASPQLYAKTLYVEKWGSNLNPCSRSSPCVTISHAIFQSKKNGRIVVGPGQYRENLTIDINIMAEPLEGLKLESASGRYATIIEANNPNVAAISIQQSKVRVGRKGKGFTVMGTTASSLGEIDIPSNSTSRIIIEGNLVTGGWAGIYARGERTQIKNNIALNNSTYGIGMEEAPKGLVSDNTLIGNWTGLFVTSTQDVTILRNLALNNTNRGLVSETSSATTGIKVKDNVATLNSGRGIWFGNVDGGTMQGNISSNNGDQGVLLGRDAGSPGDTAQIRDNLSVGNVSPGFDVPNDNFSQTRLERNGAISNGAEGFILDGIGVLVDLFRNNNSIANDAGGSNCGVYNTTGLPFEATNHFYGAGDVTCGVVSGTPASKPARVRVTRASKL